MARPRRPVQSLQDSLAPRLAPQASPVAAQSVVAPPADLPIYDFAAISESLAGSMRRSQEIRNKAAQQKGEQFAEENRLVMADLQEDLAGVDSPEERDRIQKEAFAALRRAGEIPDAADINWRIGLERANGRIMVGKYWQNLQRRLPDVSTVVGPDGLPREPLAAEAIMAEEWDRISKSPAVKGFYGGQEALAQKVDADAQFLQAVTNARSKAEQVHYQDVRAREIGKLFDDALASNDVVGTDELKTISAYVANEVRTHNILTPREDVMNAIELSIKRKAAISGSEAVRAVEAAEDIVIGGVRLGDDRSGVGERLQALKAEVRAEAAQSDEEELRAETNERKLAVQKGEADFVPKLLQAKREGQSVRKMAQALEEDYLRGERFGGREAFVVRAMQEFATELERDAVTDPDVVHTINRLVADGRLDEAESLSTAALKEGALSGTDYGASLDLIQRRSSLSRFMEDDTLYKDTVAGLDRAVPRGFVPEVQDRFEQQGDDLKAQFNQSFEAFVRSTEGKPNREALHRAELNRMSAEYRKVLVEAGKEQRTKHDEALRDISQRMSRFQDASDLIDRAEAEGGLTILEAQKQREENLRAGLGRDELVEIANKEAGPLLEARLAALGVDPTDQNQITLQETARRVLRDELGIALDAMIADPAIEPRAFTSRARAEANRVVDEVGDRLFPTGKEAPAAERRAVQRGIEAGEPAQETLDRVQRLSTERAVAAGIENRLADPVAREQIQAVDPIFQPVTAPGGMSLHTEGIPPRFYEYAAAWWSGRDPIFGTPVLREDMDRQVHELAGITAGQPDQAEIIAGALDVVGYDAVQVLRGEAVLDLSERERTELAEQLAMESASAAIFPSPQVQARVRALQARLEPVRISLEGHEFKPHLTPFFRSREAFSAFTDNPSYPDFLRRIGLDPGNEEEIRLWRSFQAQAIDRSLR